MLSNNGCVAFAIAIFMAGITVAPSATAAADDACSLLTQAQVGAALGVPVSAGTYVMATTKKTCTWKATGKGGEIATLMLSTVDEHERGKKGAAYGATFAPLSGVGDDAYYLGTEQFFNLFVSKGITAFKVAVYAKIPVEKQQSIEKALAEQAVSAL